MSRASVSISLPAKMLRQVDEASKREQRDRSELIREAIRLYFDPDLAARIARLPVYVPTKQELQAIEKGRRSKSYLTLDELRRSLAGPRRSPRPKSTRARA